MGLRRLLSQDSIPYDSFAASTPSCQQALLAYVGEMFVYFFFLISSVLLSRYSYVLRNTQQIHTFFNIQKEDHAMFGLFS